MATQTKRCLLMLVGCSMLSNAARTRVSQSISKTSKAKSPPAPAIDQNDLERFSLDSEISTTTTTTEVEDDVKPPAEDAGKAAAEGALKSLSASERDSLLSVWGREHLLELFEAQVNEAKKDAAVVGSSLYKDFLKWQKDSLNILTKHKADRNGKSCSELPGDVMGHIWRYKIDDIKGCLGGWKPSEANSFLQSRACDGTADEVPNSDGWKWTFSRCSSYGAERCTIAASGSAGCCCPAGLRWDVGEGKCVACASMAHLWPGQTCKLRCALLPEVETTLTCGNDRRVQGSAPEGACRWVRDKEPVQTHAGSVLGIVRPILWRWNLQQYPEYVPEGMQIPINTVEAVRIKTFWDIPFGKPLERFKRPEMVESFSSPLLLPDRFQDGHTVQHCDPDGVPDCLTLAIDVPPAASKDNLRPVMFWIPGSGFRSADMWNVGFYDGAQYVLRQDSLIVISNGRSSIGGHWASSALIEEDEDGSTGNYGMMDQRLALEWIQNNIANFGGDPTKVTIGGHSSGGFSVNFHLFSPHSRGLFSGAITEGSTFDSGWYFQNLDDAKDFYANLGVSLGCPREDPKQQISCLRKLDSKAFSSFLNGQSTKLGTELSARLTLWTGIKKGFGFLWSYFGFEGGVPEAPELGENDLVFTTPPLWPVLTIGPVVDGSNAGLPAAPFDLMHRDGGVAKVPVFLDFAKDEGTLFSMMFLGSYPWQRFPTLTHASVDTMLDWTFGDNDAVTKQILSYYPTSSGSPFTRLANAITDSVFKCSNRRFANALSSKIPVFVSETDYDPSKNKSSSLQNYVMSLLGANHVMATGLVFGVPLTGGQANWSAHDQAISAQLNCYYAYFLHCRNPDVTDQGPCFEELVEKKIILRSCLDPANHKDVWNVHFKAFDPAAPTKFSLRTQPKVVEWTSDEKRVCDFWDANPPSKFRMVPNICRGCKEVSEAE